MPQTPVDSQSSQPRNDKVTTIDTITLTGLKARGFHGVLEHERTEGQDFVADVEVSVERFPDGDDLSQTVDYAAMADVVVQTIQSGPYRLIETLAEQIATNVLDFAPSAPSVRVTVHKPNAPIAHAFQDVAVTITRSR